MIITQSMRRDQHERRMALKTAGAAFACEIVRGTSCTRFESEIIVEKAMEAFGLGQWEEPRVLQDGQIVFYAVTADAKPGCEIDDCPKLRLVLTLVQRGADLVVRRAHGASAMRRQQIVRMAVEAKEQGGLLTQEDLALLLGCDVRTIRRDIHKLRSQDITVPTRGTMRDIGPGVSHKIRAVQLWLSGNEPLEVARRLNHALSSIERYVQTFCRVVYAQRRLRNILKTAMVVGISRTSAESYWNLHWDLVEKDSFYRERLDEILEVGQECWTAVDGKKSRLRMLALEGTREDLS
jgi:hypothetical protein